MEKKTSLWTLSPIAGDSLRSYADYFCRWKKLQPLIVQLRLRENESTCQSISTKKTMSEDYFEHTTRFSMTRTSRIHRKMFKNRTWTVRLRLKKVVRGWPIDFFDQFLKGSPILMKICTHLHQHQKHSGMKL